MKLIVGHLYKIQNFKGLKPDLKVAKYIRPHERLYTHIFKFSNGMFVARYFEDGIYNFEPITPKELKLALVEFIQ